LPGWTEGLGTWITAGGDSIPGVIAGGFLSIWTEEVGLPGRLTIFNELGFKNKVAKFFFFFSNFQIFKKKIFIFKFFKNKITRRNFSEGKKLVISGSGLFSVFFERFGFRGFNGSRRFGVPGECGSSVNEDLTCFGFP
jgi:hypothetical protein